MLHAVTKSRIARLISANICSRTGAPEALAATDAAPMAVTGILRPRRGGGRSVSRLRAFGREASHKAGSVQLATGIPDAGPYPWS
jgi:hypothetical protein